MQTTQIVNTNSEIALSEGTGILKLSPKSIPQVVETARFLIAAGMAKSPKNATPEQGVFQVAGSIVAGMRIGLDPFQAVQSVTVINGRPALWGDAVMAVVQASGLLEAYKEEWYPRESNPTAVRVVVRRKGVDGEFSGTFSVDSAKAAGLFSKGETWGAYTADMLLARARSRALRRGFADVLGGLYSAEEAQDAVTTADSASADSRAQAQPVARRRKAVASQPQPFPPEESETKPADAESSATIETRQGESAESESVAATAEEIIEVL